MDFATSCEKVYKRIVLKLSGEALKGEGASGIDLNIVKQLISQIKMMVQAGIEIAVVIGGGNIFRGVSVNETGGIDRVTGDYMGMLATVINGLALQDVMQKNGIPARIQAALDMGRLVEPFILGKTTQYLKEKKVVIFVAGTGNPFFSTDTAAALRASEIKADAIFKATKVEGVYSADPMKDPNAKLYHELNYEEVLSKQLKVMDATAISICMENKIPILVFNMNKENNIIDAIMGKKIGTIIRG